MSFSFKKTILLAIVCLSFLVACSKSETQFSGRISQASPLARIEIIEAGSIATLPLVNIGLTPEGKFSKTVTVPHSGMYILSYNGRLGTIYLQKGKDIQINAQEDTFPEKFVVQGKGKEDNAFVQQSQEALQNYIQKYDQNIFASNEEIFLESIKRLRQGLLDEIERVSKVTGAGSEVVQWQKNDLEVNILVLLSQYVQIQKINPANPGYTPSPAYQSYIKSLEKDDFLEQIPTYRQYLLSKEKDGYESFISKKQSKSKSNVGKLIDYLRPKKGISQNAKDYMAAFLATSMDLQPESKTLNHAMKEIHSGISSKEIKNELERLSLAIQGPKINTEITHKDMLTVEGKPTRLTASDRPQLIFFYASWNPNLIENHLPILKEIQKIYGKKVQLTLVNMDDTEDQFKKTASASIASIPGIRNLYTRGGLESPFAIQIGQYGFKLPNALIIEKNRVKSPTYTRLDHPDLIQRLNIYLGAVPQNFNPSTHTTPTTR